MKNDEIKETKDTVHEKEVHEHINEETSEKNDELKKYYESLEQENKNLKEKLILQAKQVREMYLSLKDETENEKKKSMLGNIFFIKQINVVATTETKDSSLLLTEIKNLLDILIKKIETEYNVKTVWPEINTQFNSANQKIITVEYTNDENLDGKIYRVIEPMFTKTQDSKIITVQPAVVIVYKFKEK